MLEFVDGKGVGLAANQVGYNNKVIVFKLDNEFIELVNPHIVVKAKPVIRSIEECLSIPGKSFVVDRFESVIVLGQKLDGSKVSITAFDLTARILQHELDHLDGRLISDIAVAEVKEKT